MFAENLKHYWIKCTHNINNSKNKKILEGIDQNFNTIYE